MKLFKNKKTGKMYVTLSEEKDCLVGFDGVPYTGSSDDVEEVSTTASAQDFRRLHEEANGFSIGCSVNVEDPTKVTIEITHSATNENKRKYKVGDKFSFSLKNGERLSHILSLKHTSFACSIAASVELYKFFLSTNCNFPLDLAHNCIQLSYK